MAVALGDRSERDSCPSTLCSHSARQFCIVPSVAGSKIWKVILIHSIHIDFGKRLLLSFHGRNYAPFYKSPGDNLEEWTGLIYDSCSLKQLKSEKFFQDPQEEEDALLRAYASPSDVISLALHPQIGPISSSSRLVSVSLCDWAEFYTWLGISFSSPLALLLHWPLTIYHTLNELLPTSGGRMIQRILDKRSRLAPCIQVITMIGPNISPYANGKKYLLSHRMSASIWRGTYHQYVDDALLSGAYRSPDLVIGFNVGFVAYPTWKKTLEVLKILRSVGLHHGIDTFDPRSTLALLTLNPFRSPILIRVEAYSNC
ncbi:hypothetical protein TcWFU_004943 [Taenia crassiceps]|uniref:Mitochondrial splicing suppressor 51-like C-terminal domain-containing protein n=1 Tax=Taenia crassiceps TaxID=6207 RepID=A0ABR4Q9B0_9CEST